MKKIILSLEQVRELVLKNRYRVDEATKFLSRCIDGRYQNNLRSNLPALAFPGADVGELALIFATGNSYGFEVDKEKAYQTLIEIIGGEKNFSIHTDHHGDKKNPASGCGHWKQINLDPGAYSLEKDQIDLIQKKLNELKKKKVTEIVLEGEHLEGAVLLVSGNYGILPRYKLETDSGRDEVEAFVYHQSLVDARHRALCSALLSQKAVNLYNGCDGEYLYQVLSEMAENHLMETAKRLAKGLPIYEVGFEEDGDFEIKEIGRV